MAKAIVLTLGDETTGFDFTKVERAKLYGRKERLVVDEKGEGCVSAYLTADGSALVPPGATGFIYVDPSFDSVERSELSAVDAEGKPLPLVPSTLGAPQALVGPVDARRVLEHMTTVVYQLLPQELGPRLKEALDAGQIFETRFNYREDYTDASAFLLKGAEGIFLLVGNATGFAPVGREVSLAEADEAETVGDELDFGMM
jgi:hypothetical protein